MIRGESVQAPQQRQRAPSSTPPQQVFLEDLTLVIDVSLMVAFAAAVHLLRKRIITVATLAHALSVAFLVFTAGHYIERHIIGGVDEVEELVRPRGHARVRGGSWFTSWCSAGLMSTAAMLSLGAFTRAKSLYPVQKLYEILGSTVVPAATAACDKHE